MDICSRSDKIIFQLFKRRKSEPKLFREVKIDLANIEWQKKKINRDRFRQEIKKCRGSQEAEDEPAKNRIS